MKSGVSRSHRHEQPLTPMNGVMENADQQREMSSEERIASLLGTWFRLQNSGARYWLVYCAWLAVLWIALIEFPPFGLALLLGFFWRSFFQLSRLVRTAVDAMKLLKPILDEQKDGLNDVRFAFAVFDGARLNRVSSRKRVQAIRDAAWALVGPDGAASNWDCSAGHGDICAHRADADAVRFWKTVANR